MATYTCEAAATEARTAKTAAAENCMLTVFGLCGWFEVKEVGIVD